jgi:hypothetical protein
MRQALPKYRCLSSDNSSDLRRFVSLNIAESPKSREVQVFLKYCVILIYQRSKIHTLSRSCSNLDHITINGSQAWDNKRTTNMDSTSAPSLGKKLPLLTTFSSPSSSDQSFLICRLKPGIVCCCQEISEKITAQQLGRAEYNWTHFSVPSQAP